MAQQITTNVFQKGMVCDLNELDTSNDVLVNALNATVTTFNGNEGVLQNEMGNAKITSNLKDYAFLPKGYIPVGSVEYGGIYYIASISTEEQDEYGNPLCQIGSMPSPIYDNDYTSERKLEWTYKPLNVGLKSNNTCEFITSLLGFNLENPVNILAEQSFDGSVNLILNDGINKPRLINTGFHSLANGTFLVIKRYGDIESNTNRYNLDNEIEFDLNTSLYKDTNNISNFTYKGLLQGGLLKVGNYVFYAITCDKDGNESDIIAESGVISIFKGTDGNPFSVNGGISNETTDKSINLELNNIDSCYHYIKLYYTRTTSQNNQNAETLAYLINQLFPVNSRIKDDGSTEYYCNIFITGYENINGISVTDLNISYFNADNAKAQALSQNMLFLGNVKEVNQSSEEFEYLRDISLHITPSIEINKDFNLKSDYKYYDESDNEITDLDDKNSYYSSKFIYNSTGYHIGEIYRFGIVYIRSDNSLTPVFNVCGVTDLTENLELPEIPTSGYDISKPYFNDSSLYSNNIGKYNILGVSRISDNYTNYNNKLITDVLGIKFTTPNFYINDEYQKHINKYKGYFFVRQKRIPTMLALGYATNISEESFLPSINIPKKNTSDDKEDSGKLYLYESFATGAFKTGVSEIDDNFYPKRSTSKVENTLHLMNNYRSRLFTFSDYTYLYLDKILGTGPVSQYLKENQTLNVDYFKSSGYEVLEDVSVKGRTKKDNYLVVHYATPEKWDDHGLSDGSEGRTVLWTNYDKDLMIPVVHFFRQYDVSDISDYYKINLEVNLGENITADNLTKEKCSDFYLSQFNSTNLKTYTKYKEDPLIYRNNVNNFYVIQKDSKWYKCDENGTIAKTTESGEEKEIQIEVNLNSTYTSTKSGTWIDSDVLKGNLFKSKIEGLGLVNLLTALNYAANKKRCWTTVLHTSEEGKFSTNYSVSNGEIVSSESKDIASEEIIDPQTLYLACGPTGSDWLKTTLAIMGGVLAISTGVYASAVPLLSAAGAAALVDAKDSSVYTEILAMLLSPNRTRNAGLGINMYIHNKTTEKKGKVLFEVDGIFYEPYAAFSGYGSKPATSVDNILSQIYSYIQDYEEGGSNNSELLNDPTTPTFDGKYGLTESIDEDKYRVSLHTMQKQAFGVYCPEYELNQPYYNQIFTGQDLKIKMETYKLLLTVEDNFKTRHYIYDNINNNENDKLYDCSAIAVAENTTLLTTNKVKSSEDWGNYTYWPRSKNNYFSSKASDATEIGFKFVGGKSISHDYCYKTTYALNQDADNIFNYCKLNIKAPFNIVRGIYGSYVGVSSEIDVSDTIVGFYIPGYSLDKLDKYFNIRFNDNSAYQAISNRIPFGENEVCYRGDCYIGWYTHRVNRNFNDSTSPYNDTIISSGCLNEGFDKLFDYEYRSFDLTKDSESSTKINIGDLNAISLGSWVTFPLRSTMNTSLRSDDGSYTDEVLACGHNRTFYPLYTLDAGGSNKVSESEAFNAGYNKSGGERLYFVTNQLVWNNTYYRNRIVYSNVLLNSSLTNGHRTFLSTHYKDYTDQYGLIIKLIDIAGNLLVICEHGIFLVPVNERALAGEGSGGPVYINTSNVLPDSPKIISDTYGSTWVESIIDTPYGVFGVDELSKKIWFTNGQSIKLISDFKILKFLNEHLNIDKLKIGTSNLKSHYNKYKNDVIFTLYDFWNEDTQTGDELWSVCYNINSESWQTFYSWIPIDSQNIGNCFVTLPLPKVLDKADYDLNNELYFYKHGLTNRVPGENIKPTKWYGRQDPFEFEFIVKDKPLYHKLFENLLIISNKAEPESFHYEIVGECYDFAPLKEASYYCLEKLKSAYSGLSYNKDCVVPEYNERNFGKQINFPMYYARQDIRNLIYDNYKQFSCPSYDYNYLTGTELVRYKDKDEYRLWNHTKAVDASKHGLLRGNMRYKEDKWDVQINPMFFVERNTNAKMWENGVPLFVNDINIGNDSELLFNGDSVNCFVDHNTYNKRKSIKVKDKYVKVRIRYSGKDLALISAINTLYTISYA